MGQVFPAPCQPANRRQTVLLPLMLAAVLMIPGPGGGTASAQNVAESLLGQPAADTGSEILFESDHLTYLEKSDTVIATGNVKLYYGKYSLKANRVRWIRPQDKIIAIGDVFLKDKDGNVMAGPYAELKDKFREGFVKSVSLIMTNNARMAAASARRTDGNITTLNKVVYTACDVCAEHPEKAPLWQIRAVKVIHNKEEATLRYEDATFEFFGVPVMYMPVFVHPDPTVKRKSGFLIPGISITRHFGFGVTIPYFWNLAPNYDITFRPLVTSKQGVLADFQWRHRLRKGTYSITPSFIYELSPDPLTPVSSKLVRLLKTRRLRGSIKTKGNFSINRFWRWGWNITAVTDDTFRRDYNLSGSTNLRSNLFLTGLGRRNYFNAEIIRYRGLLAEDRSTITPFVLPVMDSSIFTDDGLFGGELEFSNSLVKLARKQGKDTLRLTSGVHWRRTYTDRIGQQFTPFMKLRGDFYRLDYGPNAARNDRNYARFVPLAGLEYRWAFASPASWGSQVFTPIAQILARPNEKGRRTINNEDSQSFEFDDTNLFSYNKFQGFDRVESGVRANVGFRYRIEHNSGGYAALTFGESFHLAGKNSFDTDTGLKSTRSDYVGALYLYPFNTLKIGNRFRLDKDNFAINRYEADLKASYGPFSIGGNYTYLRKQPALGEPRNRQEVRGDASVRFARYWTLTGSGQYDIRNTQVVKRSLGIGYNDECFNINLRLEESFVRDRNIKPQTKVYLSFSLATIGGSSLSVNANNYINN